jgi:hypothetical protein
MTTIYSPSLSNAIVNITAIGTANNTPIKPNINPPNNIQININSALTHNVLFIIIGVRTLFSDWFTRIYTAITSTHACHHHATRVTSPAITIQINGQIYGMKFIIHAINESDHI